jgi:hypothetical protein
MAKKGCKTKTGKGGKGGFGAFLKKKMGKK